MSNTKIGIHYQNKENYRKSFKHYFFKGESINDMSFKWGRGCLSKNHEK